MTVTVVTSYRVSCDRDTGEIVPRKPSGHPGPVLIRPYVDHQTTIFHATGVADLNDQLVKAGWLKGKWQVKQQAYEYSCPWCVDADEHERNGPWCKCEQPDTIFPSRGPLICRTCDGKVFYKPPGVYC